MPVPWDLFLSFCLAALIICITPGPDMVYVVSFGVSQGRLAGVAAALGVAVGMGAHSLLAALGIAFLIGESPTAMTVMSVVGACYLVFLGVQMIRSRDRLALPATAARRGLAAIVGRSALVNLTNPKIVLFYVTFLPQFTDPGSGSVQMQLLVLGLVFMLMGLMVDSAVGLASGQIASLLVRSSSIVRRVNTVCGGVLCALALVLGAGVLA